MNLRATAAAFKQQAIQFMADPQWILPSIIAPFIFTVVALFMYGSDDGSVVLQAVLGGGVLGMWGNTLFASGYSITYDRYNGTIEPIMMSSTNLIDVVAGRAIWNTMIGLLNALLVFIIAELMFQTPVTIHNPAAFFGILILTLGSLACIGLIFSAFVVWTRMSTTLFSILEFPIYILSGAMVPISLLPGGLTAISYALPTCWGVDAMKLAALGDYDGAIGTTIGQDLIMTVVLMLIYASIAFIIFKYIERNVRMTGSLTRY